MGNQFERKICKKVNNNNYLVGLDRGRGPPEVWPAGVRDEGLDDVAGGPPVLGLVQQGEGDGVAEGPPQDGVELAREDLDVGREVAALAGAVAVEEQGGL